MEQSNETQPVRVVDRCTTGNFFEEGYTLYNPDIKAHVDRGGSAAHHFEQYGHREVRFQFTPQFLARRAGPSGAERYSNFREKLGLERHTPRFLEQDRAVPVILSDKHYERGDYIAESANDSFPPFLDDIAAHPNGLFMDLGCGVRKELYENCLYVEVYPSLTADVIVSTDCEYPFPNETFDGIGCFSVLEHTTNPWKVAKEIHRMLKPGGRCYIDWPFLAPVHGYPSHYFNATREGLKLAFSDGFALDDCSSWHSQGPDHSIHWILHSLLSKLPTEEQTFVRGLTVGELSVAPPQGDVWMRILNALPSSVIEELAAGNSLIARKI